MSEIILGVPKIQLAPIKVLAKLQTELHSKTCPRCGWAVNARSRDNMIAAYREHIVEVHKEAWAS